MTEEVKVITAQDLTEKAKKALAFLQDNDGEYFGHEIAEEIGVTSRGIHGVMNALFGYSLVTKTARPITIKAKGKDGEMVDKETTRKSYALTQAGLDLDLSAPAAA